MTTRKLVAWIDLEEPEEFVEGHFWATEAGSFKLEPSDEKCPFCAEPMRLVRCRLFGRICQEQGTRTKTRAQALVELLPATHEALSCSGCEIVLTRVIGV